MLDYFESVIKHWIRLYGPFELSVVCDLTPYLFCGEILLDHSGDRNVTPFIGPGAMRVGGYAAAA